MRLATLLVCSLSACRAFGYTRLQNTAGTNLAMPAGECDVVVGALPPDASFDRASLEAAVDRAIAAWSALPGLPVRLMRVTTPTADRPVIFITDRTKQWGDDERYLALSAHASKAHAGTIVEVDTDIDDVFHEFSDVDHDLDAASMHRHDLTAVLTHELGHALGLGHSADRGASMYPDIAAGEKNARIIGDDDRAGIAAIYATSSVPADSTERTTTAKDDAAQTAAPASACSMGGRATGNPAAFAVCLLAFLTAVAVLSTRVRRYSSSACRNRLI